MPDKTLGDSAIADQIPLNKDLNANLSYSMETMRKVGGAKVMVPTGSNVKPVEIDGAVGQFVEYNDAAGTKPPFVMGGTGLPAGYADIRSFVAGSLQDVSGNHEVSQGGTPQGSNRISGSALKLLLDSEFIRQSPVMRRFKTSLKILCEIIIRMVKSKYSDTRKLDIVGEGNEYELMEFTKADLKGNFSVTIQLGSAFDSSPSAKIEGLFNLWDRGIPQAATQGDPSAKAIMRALEFGNTQEIVRIEKLHRNKALWVSEMIKKEKKIPDISSEDDHETHIEVLVDSMLAPEFYKETETEIYDQFQKRIDTHREFIMERNAQVQASQQGQSAPEQNPSGEPPTANIEQEKNMSMGGEGGLPT